MFSQCQEFVQKNLGEIAWSTLSGTCSTSFFADSKDINDPICSDFFFFLKQGQ